MSPTTDLEFFNLSDERAFKYEDWIACFRHKSRRENYPMAFMALHVGDGSAIQEIVKEFVPLYAAAEWMNISDRPDAVKYLAEKGFEQMPIFFINGEMVAGKEAAWATLEAVRDFWPLKSVQGQREFVGNTPERDARLRAYHEAMHAGYAERKARRG